MYTKLNATKEACRLDTIPDEMTLEFTIGSTNRLALRKQQATRATKRFFLICLRHVIWRQAIGDPSPISSLNSFLIMGSFDLLSTQCPCDPIFASLTYNVSVSDPKCNNYQVACQTQHSIIVILFFGMFVYGLLALVASVRLAWKR